MPPCGSISVPGSASGTAIALTVKSRRARSSSSAGRRAPRAARPGAGRSRRGRGRRRSRPRRAPDGRGREALVAARARRRAPRRAPSWSPSTTTSRSAPRRPSSSVADRAADQVGVAPAALGGVAHASKPGSAAIRAASSAVDVALRGHGVGLRVRSGPLPYHDGPSRMARPAREDLARLERRDARCVAGDRRRVASSAGGGVAAYAVLKRDADVELPAAVRARGRRGARAEPREQVKTVDWPVYGYDDQRTRYLPTKRVRPPFDASEWSFQAGKLLEFSPIVADGTLYFQDKDALFYALDADKGKVEWKKEIGDLGASSPAYSRRAWSTRSRSSPGAGGVAMRARDGKVLWRVRCRGAARPRRWSSATSVIVGSESGDVFALDPKTARSMAGAHRRRGQGRAGARRRASSTAPTTPARCSRSAPRTARSSGSRAPRGSSFGRGGPVYSTPAVAFGRVFLGSIDGRVYSFDADSGELLWSHSTGDWVYAGAGGRRHAERTEPTVYVGSKDQNFYALDAETGDVRWQKHIGGDHPRRRHACSARSSTSPALGPNIGTVGFDVKTGKQVFESELGEYNPVISDGERIYLTGASGIRAFEHETEAERRARRSAASASASKAEKRAASARRTRRSRSASGRHTKASAGQRKCSPREQRLSGGRPRARGPRPRSPGTRGPRSPPPSSPVSPRRPCTSRSGRSTRRAPRRRRPR